MFDQLSERLQATLSDVRSRGTLNEGDVDAAMREIRLALLEADVNFKVVKGFTKALKERCLGADVLEEPRSRPAGREDRQRGADGADGRREPRPGDGIERADGDPDGRPAGLGEDDSLREARPAPARVGQGRRARRLRRLPTRSR